MLSPVPGPTTAPGQRRAASPAVAPTAASGASTSGSTADQSVSSSTRSRSSVAQLSRSGDQYPVPEASPRSVTRRPLSRQVSQSWGSSTVPEAPETVRMLPAQLGQLGDRERRDRHRAAGLRPPTAPPGSRSSSAAASGALVVSHHNGASASTVPSPSSATSPCCCAATEIAATRTGCAAPARATAVSSAVHSADHHISGSWRARGGVTGVWAVCAAPRSSPDSGSRSSTLVAPVEESMPATTGRTAADRAGAEPPVSVTAPPGSPG